MKRFVIELQELVNKRYTKIPNSTNLYMYETVDEALAAAQSYAERIGEDDRPGLKPVLIFAK